MKKLVLLCTSTLLIVGAALPLVSRAAIAGPLDSIPIDTQATTLHDEDTAAVPAGGAVGADIVVTGSAFLSIDFAVQPGKQVTLLLITADQKRQMNAGIPITGRPKFRLPIDGTASQSTTVNEGEYYVAILNTDVESVSVTYRVTARAF